MSGSEMQREKEKVAAKMREKQAAGRFQENYSLLCTSILIVFQPMRRRPLKVPRRNRNPIGDGVSVPYTLHEEHGMRGYVDFRLRDFRNTYSFILLIPFLSCFESLVEGPGRTPLIRDTGDLSPLLEVYLPSSQCGLEHSQCSLWK